MSISWFVHGTISKRSHNTRKRSRLEIHTTGRSLRFCMINWLLLLRIVSKFSAVLQHLLEGAQQRPALFVATFAQFGQAQVNFSAAAAQQPGQQASQGGIVGFDLV